jgi:hypothetical protein
MSDESLKTSNDLIRWLKMLALPAWAKVVLSLIMVAVLLSALGLLGWGIWSRDKDAMSSAVAMLTISIPVGLIVVALVFGDGGARKLKALTEHILRLEIPAAIQDNLAPMMNGERYIQAHITPKIRGCIADYTLVVTDTHLHPEQHIERQLEFKLELNVKKVNFVVWLRKTGEDKEALSRLQTRYKSCFFGAEKEGYIQNQEPLTGEKKDHVGIVFIKQLGEDFLLSPADRLYFAQDLAFFVRGLLDLETENA